jgi:hypothetical protein
MNRSWPSAPRLAQTDWCWAPEWSWNAGLSPENNKCELILMLAQGGKPKLMLCHIKIITLLRFKERLGLLVA